MVGDRGQDADAQDVTLAAGRARRHLERAIGGGERGARLGQQRLPDRCQRDPAGSAVQELRAEPALDQPQLLGQRLLGDVEPRRGGGQAARLGDRHEVAKLT